MALVLVFVVTAQGCSNLGYYAQSLAGGYDVLAQRQPISEVLQNPDVSQPIKDKLKLVLQVRTFASEHLALPDNDSYRTYVDLKRPYAVWNVFATPEFSMKMDEWCFLFGGCVRYRGYFDQHDADQFAEQLRQQGFDVYVAGIDAYSTIGYFDDPVLNTILKRDDVLVASLIFHELAHQVVFIKGDTAFNEGFAVAVEQEGIKRWLTQAGSPEMLRQYEQHKQRHDQFVALVTNTRKRLEQLYDSQMDAEQLRTQKQQLIKEMKQQYQTLKSNWNGYPGYDAWFDQPINNAQIAAVVTYQDYVPAFHQLLIQHHNDMKSFYQAVAALGDLSDQEREAALDHLLAAAHRYNFSS